MSDITELISLLSPADQRSFTSHLHARNKRHDTRNVDLFNALLNKKEAGIKKQIGSNAYNVLKKRLSDRLMDYIASSTLESEASIEINIIKQLLLARKLFAYGKLKQAFKVLHKAEEEAITISHFALLNEIYHTLIEQSHKEGSQNQDVIFKKLELNNVSFIEQERLNIVYAMVRREFDSSEFDTKKFDLKEVLAEQYEKYGVSDQLGYSFQSLYQLALIADIAGSHTQDYYSIDLFFIEKIDELTGGPGDSEKFLLYHIDLLYTVANIYFRKKDFVQSASYLERMYEQMQRYNLKFYASHLVKYTMLKALNLNFTGKNTLAAETLDNLFEMNEYPFDELLAPKLARVMIHFQRGEFDLAYKIMVKFQNSDNWYEKNCGVEWTLNMKYTEILLHIELGNYDFVDSKVASLVRKYGDFFKAIPESHVLPFLKLVKKYYHDPACVTTSEFNELVESTIQWKANEREDLILMSFYAWLKAKMSKRPLYDVTLELVNDYVK